MSDRKHRDVREAVLGAERTCPNCEASRPAACFRSAHPRTHCDVCRAAKRGDPPPSLEEASPEEVPFAESSERGAYPARGESDRETRFRLARLALLAPGAPDRCPVLGRALDAGPRSDPMSRPVYLRGVWISACAAAVISSGVTADELRFMLERESGA